MTKDINYTMPNGYYYKSSIKHCFFGKDSNMKLAQWGINNKLSCGGSWLLGKDFAFEICYAADSYNHMAYVKEYNTKITKCWLELEIHLLKYRHTMHTTKTRNDVAINLGLNL